MTEDASVGLGTGAGIFESWSGLPRLLKICVLRNLPYPTLRNFMFLSRECFDLASSVETEAFAVYLHDINYLKDEDDEENVYNNIREDVAAELTVWYIPPQCRNIPNSFEPYRIFFTNDENGGCILRRVREETQHKCYGKEARYDKETAFTAALRSFFQLTRNIKARDLSIEIERMNPDIECALKQQTTSKLTCETFRIRTEDRALPPLLFPLIPTGCALEIYTFPFPEPGDIFIESSFFDLELMRSAPSFDTEANMGVTDEQLPHLRAHSLAMKAPFVSSKGINEILLQWLEGKRKIFEVKLNQTQSLGKEEIFKGLEEYIISDSQLRNAVGDLLGPPDTRTPRVGVRNKFGHLIVVILSLNRCHLFDPQSFEDQC